MLNTHIRFKNAFIRNCNKKKKKHEQTSGGRNRKILLSICFELIFTETSRLLAYTLQIKVINILYLINCVDLFVVMCLAASQNVRLTNGFGVFSLVFLFYFHYMLLSLFFLTIFIDLLWLRLLTFWNFLLL